MTYQILFLKGIKMKKQLKNLSYLMILFTFLTSTIYADEITRINVPGTTYPGMGVSFSVDFETQDKDLVFSLQEDHYPWTRYYYKRFSANQSGEVVNFIVPDNLPTDNTPLVYQAYLTPKGKGWDNHTIAAYHRVGTHEPSTGYLEDKIKSINVPHTAYPGMAITFSVDFVTVKNSDLVFTLQEKNAPWTIYYSKRLRADEFNKEVTFIVPDNIPRYTPDVSNPAPLVYQAYTTQEGLGWANHRAVAYKDVSIHEPSTGYLDEKIYGINVPDTIYPGREVTFSVDFSTYYFQTVVKDVVFTLQAKNYPWTMYYSKRFSAEESGKEVTFVVPDNVPKDTPLVYTAYITNKGKGWAKHTKTAYHNVIVEE